VIFGNCHDFLSISTFKRSILCKYLQRISFLINLYFLARSAYAERWPRAVHGCTRLLDQTDSDTASDTGACDHKHALLQPAMQPCTSDRAGNSVLSCQPVNKVKLIVRGRDRCKQDCHAQITDQCTCVDVWVGYGSKRQMA